MSIQSVLAVKAYGTSIGAYRVVGATSALIGAPFGTGQTPPGSNQTRFANQLIKFYYGSGLNKVLLVAWVGDGTTCQIYTYDGANWTLRLTTLTTSNPHTGLHVVTISGVPTIIGIFEQNTGAIYGLSSTDGVNWTQTYIGLNENTSNWYGEIIFNNVLFWATQNHTGHISWNPADNTFTTNDQGNIYTDPMDFCVFNNALYKLAENTATSSYCLWAYNLGGWTPIATLPLPGSNRTTTSGGSQVLPVATLNVTSTTGFASSGSAYVTTDQGTQTIAYTGVSGSTLTGCTGGTGTAANGALVTDINPGSNLQGNGSFQPAAGVSRPVLFDGGDGFLYAIYINLHAANMYGFAAAQISVTGLSAVATDISSIVLPASWLYGSQPGSYSLSAVVETDSVPGDPSVPTPATPTVHLYLSTGYTQAIWSYYQWNGPTALIGNGGLANDSGADSSLAIPNVKGGGNDRIWVPSDFDVRVVSGAIPLTSAQTMFFQAFGPLGTEVKSFTHYYSIVDQIPPTFANLALPGVLGTITTSVVGLPTQTLNVASTAGFTTPVLTASTTVASGSTGVDVSTFVGAQTLIVSSLTGFPTSGTIYVVTSSGLAAITYNGVTGGFQNCTTVSGSGTLTTGNSVQYYADAGQILVATNANTTSVSGGSVGQTLPQGSITVASTVGFPSSGYLLVPTTSGNQVVTYTGTSGGNTFTGCTGGAGAGVMLATAGGVISLQVVTYTGLTPTMFTGCTGGAGNTSITGPVISGPSPAPTLNANNRQLDGVTCDGNTAIPTTYQVIWTSGMNGIVNNQRVRTGQRVF